MSVENEIDHLIKIVLVGDSSVGKSSILLRFTEGQFDPSLACTIGVDFKLHMMDFQGKVKVNLSIWDTAGQEKFHSLTGSYYRGAHAILLVNKNYTRLQKVSSYCLVYDVTKRESFAHLPKWLDECNLHATNDTVKLLIGNKIDLQDKKVATKEAQKFAKENVLIQIDLLFLECSSKDGIGIDSIFELLINSVLDHPTLNKLTMTDTKKGILLFLLAPLLTNVESINMENASAQQSLCEC